MVMQGGSKVGKIAGTRTTPAISKEVLHPSLHLSFIPAEKVYLFIAFVNITQYTSTLYIGAG